MGIKKIFKTITGIQGYQDRKEAKLTMEHADELYKSASDTTEEKRQELNVIIEEFGRIRLESLKDTVKMFMFYLKDMKQKSKSGEYDFLEQVDIKHEQIKELESLEMSASQILKGTAAMTAVGAAALTGVPTAITAAVTSFAAASTGTAISSLSGVAASNAVLAWLGGGTLAAGGGGVAAGAALLSTITYTATGGLAILVGGLIASAHYSKKLTEAKEYEKKVEIAVGEMEKSWIVMDGIKERIAELREITESLTKRATTQLKYLAPLIPDFETNDQYQLEAFQKCGLLVKSIGELSKTPVFDENGDLSDESIVVAKRVKALLN